MPLWGVAVLLRCHYEVLLCHYEVFLCHCQHEVSLCHYEVDCVTMRYPCVTMRCGCVTMLKSPNKTTAVTQWEQRWIKNCLCGGLWRRVPLSCS